MQESINVAIAFLAAYGYIVIFLWMFADQAALPVPSAPLLIAAGVAAAEGALDIVGGVAVATLATMLADVLWYEIGKRGGARAITTVCRLSLEPESCVTSTRNAFGRFGPTTLVIAKWLPGVQTLAPASAGFANAHLLGFLFLDLLGTLLYVLPFCLGGYFFQDQIVAFVHALGDVSGGVGLAVVVLASLYIGMKITQWVMFYRGHRLRRLSPSDLHERLQAGQPLTIVDLRQSMDYQLQPIAIPGALRIPINEIPVRTGEIGNQYDVVLVCT